MLSSSFESFYRKAKSKADEALNAVVDDSLNYEQLKKRAVDYINKTMTTVDKNIFEYIALLDTEKKCILEAEKQAVKFSLQSLTKNIINHLELLFAEYFLISEIIDNAELLICIPSKGDQMKKIICFARNGKYYSSVIKTTGDKKENYLQSFHATDLKEIIKETKKKGVQVIYDNLT